MSPNRYMKHALRYPQYALGWQLITRREGPRLRRPWIIACQLHRAIIKALMFVMRGRRDWLAPVLKVSSKIIVQQVKYRFKGEVLSTQHYPSLLPLYATKCIWFNASGEVCLVMHFLQQWQNLPFEYNHSTCKTNEMKPLFVS